MFEKELAELDFSIAYFVQKQFDINVGFSQNY
jgi:hypothetical protein